MIKQKKIHEEEDVEKKKLKKTTSMAQSLLLTNHMMLLMFSKTMKKSNLEKIKSVFETLSMMKGPWRGEKGALNCFRPNENFSFEN